MKLPRHIAIIMDGNGRWATKKGMLRIAGHKAGAESVRKTIECCLENKIEVLSLFAFSTENWDRPKEEVNYLIGSLFSDALEQEVRKLHENGVQLRVIGDIEKKDKKLQKKIKEAEKLTSENNRLKLVIALSYSGRWDITNAIKNIGHKIEEKKIKSSDITDEVITGLDAEK